MGLMAIINMTVIVILSEKAIKALKDYIKQKKASKECVFHAKDIGITEKLDYWD